MIPVLPPGQPLTCGEHLLQVQDCVYQGLCTYRRGPRPAAPGQGAPAQDAAGACRAQRRGLA